jgi:hypothetical protein
VGPKLASKTITQGISAQIPRVVAANQDAGLEATTRACSEASSETTAAEAATETSSAETTAEAARIHASHAESRDPGYSNKIGTDRLQR